MLLCYQIGVWQEKKLLHNLLESAGESISAEDHQRRGAEEFIGAGEYWRVHRCWREHQCCGAGEHQCCGAEEFIGAGECISAGEHQCCGAGESISAVFLECRILLVTGLVP